MRKCKHCGKEIPEHIAFCPECGTKQETAEPAAAPPAAQTISAVPAQGQSHAARPGTGGINIDMLNKAAYLGAVLVILAPFLPMMSVLGGLGTFSVSEISGIVTAGIVVFTVIAIYFQAQGQVDLMPIIGTGMLLLLAVGFVEYHSAMGELSKYLGGEGKAVAKAAFSFSAGFYAFVGGSVLMCLGGSGCLAHRLGMPLDFSDIIAGWKEALQRTVVMGSLRLPGWVVSLIVTGILVLLVRNIK